MSLARELKKSSPGCIVVYVGLKGDKLDRLQDEYAVFDEVYYVPAGKFRRYHGESLLSHVLDVKTLLLNARDFFRVIAGIFSSRKVLARTHPAVLFVKGGFVGLPVGVAAKVSGIPIVTHDSDSVAGLTNRIVGRWAVVHATGMLPHYYKYPKESIVHVGIPLDERIAPVSDEQQKDYKKQLGLSAGQKVVLVSGGGLGAQSLNKQIVSMAPDLLRENPDTVIFHFAGSQNLEEVEQGYQQNLSADELHRVQVIGFSTEFYKYSGAADVVITRAGATTLAELAVQGKACIVVPSPFLTGGHQVKNAHQLKDMGAVEVVPNNATPRELLKKTQELLNDDKKRRELAAKFGAIAITDASSRLSKILLEIASKQKA